jgi:hypothetical protein
MPSVSGGSTLLVNVKKCNPSTAAANQIWWLRGNATTAADQAYRLEGVGTWANRCLTNLTDVPAWQQANKVGLRTCSGDDLQKWNGSPPKTPGGMESIGER